MTDQADDRRDQDTRAPEDQIQGKPSQAEGERDGRSEETGQGKEDPNRTGDVRGDRTGGNH